MVDRPSAGRDEAPQPKEPAADAVLALVDETMKNQPVDPKRFYVTGLSMGGYATWDLLAREPKKSPRRFRSAAAVIPRSPRRFKNVPIWAFHGEADCHRAGCERPGT